MGWYSFLPHISCGAIQIDSLQESKGKTNSNWWEYLAPKPDRVIGNYGWGKYTLIGLG
jgi:hypothetical protein